VREKPGPHDSRISQLRAKIVAKRVASQIKGQRDTKTGEEAVISARKRITFKPSSALSQNVRDNNKA
jgi:hypothetical protein